MNKTLKEILVEMCNRVGADYEKMDFKKPNWFHDYTWTEKEQDDFMKWLMEYFKADKKRINDIAQFPALVRTRPKELQKLINWFIFDYGWKVRYE